MVSAATFDRFQFAFTITFHYLFPQLTMGLALLIVLFKGLALKGSRAADLAASFWGKIFGINFAFGVVTGIPMEFQFGTNWARFAQAAGGVIGQTLAMEGVFAFFLESAFLGLFLYGARRLGPRLHFLTALAVFLGSWVSGYFIVCTDAWMQNPVGYHLAADGSIVLDGFGRLLANPWQFWAWGHTMLGAVVTACLVVGSVGSFYLLSGRDRDQGRLFVKVAVSVGLPACLLVAFPFGDGQARLVAQKQPAAFAGMEALFHSEAGAPLVLMGQPDMDKQRLDNPVHLPRALSFLTYRSWNAPVKGLDSIPQDQWPTDVPLLYYAYHIMVGLGTFFIALMALAALGWWMGWLWKARWLWWAMMLALPLPYVANTAGWVTAETGRQPWVIYGLMRTAQGWSANVSSGNVLFTLLGFLGLYALLSVLFLFLMSREIMRGPEGTEAVLK